MYFIQDGFKNPIPGNVKIVLKERGDYTNKPEFISDKENNVIYQGAFFDLDTYHSLDKNLTGIILVSEKCKELVKNDFKTKEDRVQHSQKWILTAITTFIIILLSGMLYYNIQSSKKNEAKFDQISSSNTKIQEQLSLIDNKLKLLKETPKKIDTLVNSIKPEIITHHGLDISHHNGNIVDEISQIDSISFVICKATQGKHFRDPYFNSNWESLKNKKLIRGAYHFYEDDSTPIKQANHYLSVVGVWRTNDIAPIIDIEDGSLSTTKQINIEKLQKDVLKFLEHIEKETKRIPMLYTNLYFANMYLKDKAFSKYPLWLGEYTSKNQPILPKTWQDKGFKIWQKSENYHFKSTKEDLDIFYGDIKDLYKN